MAKYTSKYSGERIDHSVGVIPAGDPSEASVIVYSGVDEDKNPISTYKKVSEVGVTVVQETGDSETQVMSQKAVTNALATKVDKQSVVQETGEATDKVMSQKIVTDSLNNKINYTDINNGLTVVDGKVNANIVKIQDSNSTEFTPDENGVVTIPGARNNGKMGLFTSRSDLGLDIFGDPGYYYIVPASQEFITARRQVYQPIIPNRLNFAVKAALTDDKRMGTETSGTNTAFTDTEKDRACEILGAGRKRYLHTFSATMADNTSVKMTMYVTNNQSTKMITNNGGNDTTPIRADRMDFERSDMQKVLYWGSADIVPDGYGSAFLAASDITGIYLNTNNPDKTIPELNLINGSIETAGNAVEIVTEL